ncbi:hypothetical protein LTS02_007171 [Friedmanniomyces endolithicus]|nr:hypothetical protein LTS02_007171 [Friedmanniomyces endolithicus]
MNDYETRRLDKIKANQALLAGLDIKPVIPKATQKADSKPRPAERRKVLDRPVPSKHSGCGEVERLVTTRWTEGNPDDGRDARAYGRGRYPAGEADFDETRTCVTVGDLEMALRGSTGVQGAYRAAIVGSTS